MDRSALQTAEPTSIANILHLDSKQKPSNELHGLTEAQLILQFVDHLLQQNGKCRVVLSGEHVEYYTDAQLMTFS